MSDWHILILTIAVIETPLIVAIVVCNLMVRAIDKREAFAARMSNRPMWDRS